MLLYVIICNSQHSQKHYKGHDLGILSGSQCDPAWYFYINWFSLCLTTLLLFSFHFFAFLICFSALCSPHFLSIFKFFPLFFSCPLCSPSKPFVSLLVCSPSLFDLRRRAPSLFSSKVPHMKRSSKNMLTSHLPVISEQLSDTNTISQLVNKGLNRLPSYHIRLFEG